MSHRLLLPLLLMSLSGCSAHAPQPIQIPADQWVNARIGQNASLVSQAQTRLHQTSAVRPFTPVSTPVILPGTTTPTRAVPKSGG